ncbi:MAG: divalent metal cation transporter [Candidatus Eremiobacteraeota bacterium]|uniref:Putative manganese transport transmembrane protein n=1 Tax=mine drainage metagenome TaxID=410659 RepID=E6PED0_9ZZZZ|nr:divalent metal cation transporter [Candidatus Eremiobacteraeota bacterium]
MAEQFEAAHLDAMHAGDIRGALGTIAKNDTASRKGLWAKLVAFAAIIGPGLIVMVGDNDAGAFSTYAQAAQNYGTTLLWTLLLLIPVLFVNQEMVLRLGAVTRVGHARLILERFGKFWGAFSVIDLFILNALTIVTEFIGISLALDYFGLPKMAGVAIAAVLVMLGAATGNFRRFERFALVLCFGSLLMLPVLLMVHAPIGESVHDFFVIGMPKGADLGLVMILIIGIVGTTVAPWQLFFQQSYVIDKRITTRWLNYERWDLALGIVFVILGGFAIFSSTAGAFAGHKEFGHFQDTGAVAAGIAHYAGRLPGDLFALALMDAAIIGAAAVSLSTAYALGDVMSLNHSLHRKVGDAPVFYLVYAGLIAIAAAIVLIPGSPLGLLTNAVQVLAGVLLPSATVFLLLLSNDKPLLGPWVNTRRTNLFTGIVIAALLMLSVVLTAATLFPAIDAIQILSILGVGALLTVVAGVWMAFAPSDPNDDMVYDRSMRHDWQMPPLASLPKVRLTPLSRVWLMILRVYLILAVGLVVFRVAAIALHRG